MRSTQVVVSINIWFLLLLSSIPLYLCSTAGSIQALKDNWLVSSFCCYKENYCEHSSTYFCVNIGFHFLGQNALKNIFWIIQ